VVKALFDTNILVDFLRGIPVARDELYRYEAAAIGVVTWMEAWRGRRRPRNMAQGNSCTGLP
jgi:hypothetical protein